MTHNGGTLQVNPWFLSNGNDFAFINLMKHSDWWLRSAGGRASPTVLDANGYPTDFTGTTYQVLFVIPNQADRPGQYVVKWTGEGTIQVFGTTTASGSLTNVGTGGSGRAVLNITASPGTAATSITLLVTARGASDYIRDIAFVHADDEAAYDGGAVFGAKFKEKIVEGGFGVIRFLDWMSGSGCTAVTSAHMLPVSHFSYSAQMCIPTLYAGDTTKTGDAYSLPAPSGWAGLVDKAIVFGKFNASDTSDGASITLDVGGTGAKGMLYWASGLPISQAQSYTNVTAGSSFAAIFDAGLDKWLIHGGTSVNSRGLDAPVHVSLMVQLCNEVGAHPWFTIPPLALDPISDLPTAIATYCRDHLDAGLIPRFEPSNEVWNYAFGFAATGYGDAKERARGYPQYRYHQWYGRVLSGLGKAISAVYSNDRTRYQVICAVQTKSQVSASDEDERLTSATLVTETGVAGDAAKFWATHIAVDGYWNAMAQGNSTTEQALADEYATATTARKAEILSDMVTDNTITQSGWLGQSNASAFAAFKTWAAGHGVNGMCQYEGGYSPNYTTGNTNRNALRAASKSCPDLVREELKNFQAFLDAGGEFPSVYCLSGTGSAWPVLDPSVYVSPDPPRWEAARMWAAGKRRFRVT